MFLKKIDFVVSFEFGFIGVLCNADRKSYHTKGYQNIYLPISAFISFRKSLNAHISTLLHSHFMENQLKGFFIRKCSHLFQLYSVNCIVFYKSPRSKTEY